jgi:hypothetical protein
MPPEVTATVVDDEPEAYEQKHVHVVYDHIASHFSATRYKVVNNHSTFAATLSDNSLGLLSQNFYRVYPQGGSVLILGPVTGNISLCLRILWGNIGQLDSIEAKIC